MVFQKILRSHLAESNWLWFQQVLAEVAENFAEEAFAQAFSQVPRYLGVGAASLTAEELQELQRNTSCQIDFSRWTVDEMGRAEMLLSLSRLPEAHYEHVVKKIYRSGDNREQSAILKALSLLPHQEKFVPLALEAHRSNVLPVFAALACDNPFPAHTLDNFHFNNLVLKAIFLGLSLSRIYGLEGRLNRELAQMVDDWVAEREAAGRPVHPEVWTIICPFGEREDL